MYFQSVFIEPMMNLVLLVLVSLGTANGLKAYKSLLEVHAEKDANAGIQLISSSSKKSTDFANGLTLCGRFNYRRLHYVYSTVFQVSSFQDMFLAMGYQQSTLHFGQYSWILEDVQRDTFQIWTPEQWTHLCISFNRTSRHLIFTKDRVKLIDTIESDFRTEFLTSNILDKLGIGKRLDKHAQGSSRHAGTMTDINVWDVPLTTEQLQDWTSCTLSSGMKGNIVDWENSKWILTNVEEIQVEDDVLCNAQLGPTLIPEELNAEVSFQLCKKLNGKMYVIQDQASLDLVKLKAIESDNDTRNAHCFSKHKAIWTGWWDEQKEGEFVDMNNGRNKLDISKFDASPWKISEPNGKTKENCVILTRALFEFEDADCIKYGRCSICDIPEPPIFRLRGLDSDASFDRDFAWAQLPHSNSKFVFRGFSLSQLSFDSEKQIWKLHSMHEGSENYLYTVGGNDKYPMGTHTWRSQNGSNAIELSFYSCQENAYNCDDGTCVPITKRCDGDIDCTDASDEFDCHKIRSNKQFDLRALPPTSFVLDDQGMPSEEKQKLNVLCHVKIINFLSIDEVSAQMKLQLKITVEWTDPRVDFLNLKDDKDVNVLTQDEKDDLWMPSLVFDNTANKQQAQFRNATADGYISINDDTFSRPTPMNELHNGYIHAGKDCTITVRDYFTVDFIYNYQMDNYPFDIQKFQGFMLPVKRDQPFVQLVPGDISYEGPTDLMKNTVKKYELKLSDEGELMLEIHLGRQILNEVLTTVLPTVIIVIVSFTTNHYGPDHFDANVSVNLTALLVMVTLFISVFSSLPRTSAIKMIDVWFIFTLFIPFLEVILHTKMEMIKQDIERLQQTPMVLRNQNQVEQIGMDEARARKMKNLNCLRMIATYGLPILTLIFLLGFFIVGFVLAE